MKYLMILFLSFSLVAGAAEPLERLAVTSGQSGTDPLPADTFFTTPPSQQARALNYTTTLTIAGGDRLLTLMVDGDRPSDLVLSFSTTRGNVKNYLIQVEDHVDLDLTRVLTSVEMEGRIGELFAGGQATKQAARAMMAEATIDPIELSIIAAEPFQAAWGQEQLDVVEPVQAKAADPYTPIILVGSNGATVYAYARFPGHSWTQYGECYVGTVMQVDYPYKGAVFHAPDTSRPCRAMSWYCGGAGLPYYIKYYLDPCTYYTIGPKNYTWTNMDQVQNFGVGSAVAADGSSWTVYHQ